MFISHIPLDLDPEYMPEDQKVKNWRPFFCLSPNRVMLVAVLPRHFFDQELCQVQSMTAVFPSMEVQAWLSEKK